MEIHLLTYHSLTQGAPNAEMTALAYGSMGLLLRPLMEMLPF